MITLIDGQDKACKNLLEIYLKQTNERIQEYATTVNELKRSLEFTQCEVGELRREVNHIKREKEAKEKIRTMTDDLQAKNEKDKGIGGKVCVPRGLQQT